MAAMNEIDCLNHLTVPAVLCAICGFLLVEAREEAVST